MARVPFSVRPGCGGALGDMDWAFLERDPSRRGVSYQTSARWLRAITFDLPFSAGVTGPCFSFSSQAESTDKFVGDGAYSTVAEGRGVRDWDFCDEFQDSVAQGPFDPLRCEISLSTEYEVRSHEINCQRVQEHGRIWLPSPQVSRVHGPGARRKLHTDRGIEV